VCEGSSHAHARTFHSAPLHTQHRQKQSETISQPACSRDYGLYSDTDMVMSRHTEGNSACIQMWRCLCTERVRSAARSNDIQALFHTFQTVSDTCMLLLLACVSF
jgi:hypothetical protein